MVSKSIMWSAKRLQNPAKINSKRKKKEKKQKTVSVLLKYVFCSFFPCEANLKLLEFQPEPGDQKNLFRRRSLREGKEKST